MAVLQPLLTTKNGFNLQYEPSEIVTEYSPRMRNFILGLELGFSNSNILLVIALALLLVVTISLVTIRCRKWRKAHSKGNTSQVRVNTIGDSCTDVGDLKVKVGDNSKIVGDRIEKLKTLVGKFRFELANTARKNYRIFQPV